MTPAYADGRPAADAPLDFLWLELTNRCNLHCAHCYADSGPEAEVADPLSAAEYEQLLQQAFDVGCRKVQFIGGEPTLNRGLARLIACSAELGYGFIEVYANLTRLPEALLDCLRRHDVHVATSIYAPGAQVHDRITGVSGSFDRTVANVRRLIAAGVAVRASVVAMDENAGLLDATLRLLTDELGVRHVKVDHRRPFGRGSTDAGHLEDLCGACAAGTLCVAPDGRVAPCIMSKRWAIGSVRDERLGAIVLSERLARLRSAIDAAVAVRSAAERSMAASSCAPDNIGCPPLNQCGPHINPSLSRHARTCDPSSQCGPVIGCPPLNRCGPEINGVHRDRPSLTRST